MRASTGTGGPPVVSGVSGGQVADGTRFVALPSTGGGTGVSPYACGDERATDDDGPGPAPVDVPGVGAVRRGATGASGVPGSDGARGAPAGPGGGGGGPAGADGGAGPARGG